VRGKEIIGSHISCSSSHNCLLIHIGRALSSSRELEEVVYLLSVLLIVRVAGPLLSELRISYLTVSRHGSIGTHALLGETDHANAVIHFTREHVLIRRQSQDGCCEV
jgi:hypothetical protein